MNVSKAEKSTEEKITAFDEDSFLKISVCGAVRANDISCKDRSGAVDE